MMGSSGIGSECGEDIDRELTTCLGSVGLGSAPSRICGTTAAPILFTCV